MPRLGDNEDMMRVLKARIDAIDATARRANNTATAAVTTSAKRFRVGIFSVPLTLLGAQVTGTVKWSTPITDASGELVDAYNVDASCSAFSTPMNPTYTNQTSAGVTVTFNAPLALAAGTMVVVLGIAPVAPS